jgi:hypothetical protein
MVFSFIDKPASNDKQNLKAEGLVNATFTLQIMERSQFAVFTFSILVRWKENKRVPYICCTRLQRLQFRGFDNSGCWNYRIATLYIA